MPCETKGVHAALSLFDSLSLKERLFVRGRLFTAPLIDIAARTPPGRIVDVGCGHGVLSALLAYQRPDRTVTGIDPDGWKISQARASVGTLSNTRFDVATIEQLAAREPHSADAVVVADVLYLLPRSAWASFLTAARTLLAPHGVFLIKEAETDGSWRQTKALLQEQLMVRVFRRTHSSGAIGLVPRDQLVRAMADVGLRVTEIVPQSQGYTTPHVLFCAECV